MRKAVLSGLAAVLAASLCACKPEMCTTPNACVFNTSTCTAANACVVQAPKLPAL